MRWVELKWITLACASLFLAACHNTDVHYKVLIGATTTVEQGSRPIEDAVIVIEGTKIRDVGARKYVPIPQNSDRTELIGRWIIPAAGKKIANGEPANLLILDHAPAGIVPANQNDIGARIVEGEWAPK
jgi:hypothetical protein